MLSATTLQADPATVFDMGALLQTSGAIPTTETIASSGSLNESPTIATSAPPPPNRQAGQALASGALLQTAPFPLDQTFSLHSLPDWNMRSDVKTIYLDFQGFLTRDTQWNTSFNLPNILTPAYDLDGDLLTFSDLERMTIQTIWERVAEDYRPFDVDVTTEDPGVAALMNTSAIDGVDEAWGQRVVIGGSTNDWYTPVDGKAVGGVSYLNSFPWDTDTPNFAFAADFQFPEDIAEVISHETGHSLGLVHDSQFRFYKDVGADPPETVRLFVEYYAGHGSGDTAWAPIMGVGYGKNITQWSKGEYFNATNDKDGANPLQDDLAVITSGNGFDYRTDDHGDTTATASPVVQDPLTADSDTSLFEGEGIIERNTDIDFFSFTVEGLGELVSLDIQPFYNGPNLDVLAKLYDSSGAVIATSDSIDELGATFVDQALLPGTYYVSVEGGSRPITFIDPTFHPDLFEAEGNPPDPALPPDLSDWGYSNYGSLGYYSIAGTRKKALVVGVDFDIDGGASPTNWNQYTGGTTPETLTDLISELGETVPFTLSINSTGNMIDGVGSANPIDGTDLPNHGLPLDELGGYVSTTDDTLTFTWGNLAPNSVYQIYVFGHADINAENSVIVDGGQWNGVQQSYSFTQVVSPDGLVVNNNAPGNDDLSTYSLLVISDGNGEITITAAGAEGLPLAIAGLAISPTKVGSISGQKWDDANGNRANDSGEAGLPDWVIYLDLNNDGQLNSSSGQDVTVPAPEVPQDLLDNATFKNELTFDEPGEILDLNVSLDITHTYDADLRVYLVSPSGTKVKLFANIGGANDNFTNTTLDDEAAISITSGLAPYTGSFRPQESLSAFDGEDAAGIWTLEVQDDANGDTGTLNSWSITVNTAPVFLEPYAVTDASGNYTFTDLPAGQYYVREHFLDQQTQDGWKQTLAPAPVTVRSGADVTDVDFGNWIPVAQEGSIQGQKFSDLNGDGVKDANEPGLGDWIVYIDANHNGERDIANSPTTIAATDLPKAITDFHTINSQVTFDGLGTVFSVEVTLDITHSFVGDLNAYLIGPSGRQVELFTEVGGQYNDLHNITLDDSAARSIATLGIDDLPYTGTWQPEGHLSDFIGEDAAGLWTLQISDTAFADQGTLNSWSLKITSGEVYRTTDDDGNYSFDALPPGDYVVREESKSGWVQISPAVTQLPAGAAVPAAEWSGSQWNVTIAGVDDPNDPDGPDSHRNVKNVDFGNQAVQALPGDFDRSGVVDMRDYVLWRKTLGTSVSNPYDGADGDGNSMVEQADYTIWRSNYGNVSNNQANNAAVASNDSTVSSTGQGAGTTLALSSAAALPSLEESSGVLPPSDTVADTEQSLAPAFAAGSPAASTTSFRATHLQFVQKTATSEANSDAALLAWIQSLAARGDGAAATNFGSDAATLIRRDANDDALSSSVDSIFDQIGAALVAEGCAV